MKWNPSTEAGQSPKGRKPEAQRTVVDSPHGNRRAETGVSSFLGRPSIVSDWSHLCPLTPGPRLSSQRTALHPNTRKTAPPCHSAIDEASRSVHHQHHSTPPHPQNSGARKKESRKSFLCDALAGCPRHRLMRNQVQAMPRAAAGKHLFV